MKLPLGPIALPALFGLLCSGSAPAQVDTPRAALPAVGYGDKSPRTLGGRLGGLVWMFAAILIVSGFAAAIALPTGSPLRESLNLAILEEISSEDWQLLLTRYLGADH